MNKAAISYKYTYSYPINNSNSTVSNISGIPLDIEILSAPNISFTLSPPEIYNIKWQDKLKFNVLIKNESASLINDFNIKLISSDNLTYIKGTLMNSDTGAYYPCVDFENNYCITESIAPYETLNLNYYLMPLPDSSQESYINNPLKVCNSTEIPSLQTTNNSYIYLSQQKLVINTNESGNIIFIENRGTINSSTFIYKYMPPADLLYSRAFLSGIPFQNIVISKLGSYYLFKIGPLPTSTPQSIKILTLIFS